MGKVTTAKITHIWLNWINSPIVKVASVLAFGNLSICIHQSLKLVT